MNNKTLELIGMSSENMQFVKNVSKEFCLNAIQKNSWVIKYINNPSYEIQLTAVRKNGFIIRYIINNLDFPSEELCLEAFKQNTNVIRVLDSWSSDLCKKIIKKYKMEKLHEENNKTIYCFDKI